MTMKKNLFYCLVALASALLVSCGNKSIDFTQIDSFVEARPVWAEGRETEKNLTLSFRDVVKAGPMSKSLIRITASSDYRLRINGEFVAHGPSVAAHDFYRVDCYDLTPYMKWGKNIVAIEVAGYNDDSYYLLNQPSFLQAEVEVGGKVVTATGNGLQAYELKQRVQNVPEFSFQRPYVEKYILAADFEQWATDKEWTATPVKLAFQEKKELLPRHVAYPDYTTHAAVLTKDNIYKFKCNSTGFLGLNIKVKSPSKIRLGFDEILNANGQINYKRLSCQAYVDYELQPGEYTLESFEPYTMQYVQAIVEEGECEVKDIYMRNYCNSDAHRGTFYCDNDKLNEVYEAARETYRQNALDIFMDCPSRERAGWLCDSYFTSRVAFDLSGNTRIEKNFLENFLLPKEFKHIDKGMLPMCYPSDHPNKNHIPNWAMWYVIELEEYLYRSGDRALIDRAKQRVYDLIDYFKPFINEDGLLEKLTRWVFVEWSEANNLVQDVSYPSNMLYSMMLDVASRLYNDPALAEQAAHMREQIRRQSFDGEYFVDNAKRSKGGRLELTGKHTEACQYYAFFTGVATPELHPELWSRLRDEFGPERKKTNAYEDVPFANAFIGNYLRMELLSREGLSKQILDETIDFYHPMAEQTGTLWENMTTVASCNHGFASHIIRVLNRDVLGIYDISTADKKVTLRFADCGLTTSRGSIPVGQESVDLEWTMADGKLSGTIALPEGYTFECLDSDLDITINIQK